MTTAPSTGLEAALFSWRSAIGPDNVITHASTRAAAEAATFLTSHSVPAVIRPGNRAEVQACVRIANDAGVPIYPVSGGKNWGYGSRVPSADACLMELVRMNRIVDFCEELAHVTVEPGVTQGILYNNDEGEFVCASCSELAKARRPGRIECWRIVPEAKFDPSKPLRTYDRCAIEEYQTDSGPADYALCGDGKILAPYSSEKNFSNEVPAIVLPNKIVGVDRSS